MKKSKKSKARTLVPIENPKTNPSKKRLPKVSAQLWWDKSGGSKYHK